MGTKLYPNTFMLFVWPARTDAAATVALGGRFAVAHCLHVGGVWRNGLLREPWRR